MTDADRRTPRGNGFAASRQPAGDLRKRQFSKFARSCRPARKNLVLHLAVVRAEHPVGETVIHRKARGPEAFDGANRTRGTKCRSKALVGSLMLVERGDNCSVGGINGLKFDPAVIYQRRIERNFA